MFEPLICKLCSIYMLIKEHVFYSVYNECIWCYKHSEIYASFQKYKEYIVILLCRVYYPLEHEFLVSIGCDGSIWNKYGLTKLACAQGPDFRNM